MEAEGHHFNRDGLRAPWRLPEECRGKSVCAIEIGKKNGCGSLIRHLEFTSQGSTQTCDRPLGTVGRGRRDPATLDRFQLAITDGQIVDSVLGT